MYLAHISEDKCRQQTVKEHLEGTAKLAGGFADSFACREWGEVCGILHDIGKYSEGFQKRLQGGAKTDHATAGAQELWKRNNIIAAYCVSGHHSGLLDGGTQGDSAGEATLLGRLKKKVENYHIFESEVEFPGFPAIPLRQLGEGGFSLSFFIRMLFSCLVDADYLDTEAFMSEGTVERSCCDSMETLLVRIQEYVADWMKNTDADTVNGRRTLILKACFQAGKEKRGLFQLTVPTGGGKTVASLAFALKHAAEYGMERIIYVIPYTSIIEQNAKIFRDILGADNVIEDHCNVVYDSEEELKLCQLSSENWDRPVVVTTNVQFFESLFSSKSSKCRKLHNIANSVIIFDEAQMLPVKYLKPCIQVISELVFNYHSTAVLCTATQPHLKQFFPAQIQAREICPDVQDQYRFFKRTLIRKIGCISEDELVDILRGQKQALCILNSRKRVQNIYQRLDGEGTFHLSTLMYPEHRMKLLQQIRCRLREGKVCRLIATSLVEAGVDFDFRMVYRELAGIDSVIQAAGRCNREGKHKIEECITTVFTMETSEDIHVPPDLKLPAGVAEQITEKYEDISSLEAIQEYFTRLFMLKGEGLDGKEIIRRFEKGARSFLFPFREVARDFRLIENETKTILIDKEPDAAAIKERIQRGEHSRQLLRDAGHYCVNVYNNDFEALNGAGRLEAIGMDFYVLRNKEQYTEKMGLILDVSRGEAVIF